MRQLFLGRAISRPNPRAFISPLPSPSYFQVASKFKLNFFFCCSALQGAPGRVWPSVLVWIPLSEAVPLLWDCFCLDVTAGSAHPCQGQMATNPPAPLWGQHSSLCFKSHIKPYFSYFSFSSQPKLHPLTHSSFVLGMFYPFNPKNGSMAGLLGRVCNKHKVFLPVFFRIHQILGPQEAFNLPMNKLWMFPVLPFVLLSCCRV